MKLIKNWVESVKNFFLPKKVESTLVDEATKEKLQILAGVKQHDRDKGTNDLNKMFARVKPIPEDVEWNLNVTTTPIEIDIPENKHGRIVDYRFDSLPMRSLSTEAKEKIIEIVSADIAQQAEARAVSHGKIWPEQAIMWANQETQIENLKNDEQRKES